MTDVHGCGIAATTPGSIHSHIPKLPREALVANATEAESFVANRVATAVDFIGMVADVAGPNQGTLNALCASAHRSGKLVIAPVISMIAT